MVAQTPASALVTSSNPSRQAQDPQQDDVIIELRQQLAAKEEQCYQLMNRLDAMEEANSKNTSCQIQLQDNFVKVSSTLNQLASP